MKAQNHVQNIVNGPQQSTKEVLQHISLPLLTRNHCPIKYSKKIPEQSYKKIKKSRMMAVENFERIVAVHQRRLQSWPSDPLPNASSQFLTGALSQHQRPTPFFLLLSAFKSACLILLHLRQHHNTNSSNF